MCVPPNEKSVVFCPHQQGTARFLSEQRTSHIETGLNMAWFSTGKTNKYSRSRVCLLVLVCPCRIVFLIFTSLIVNLFQEETIIKFTSLQRGGVAGIPSRAGWEVAVVREHFLISYLLLRSSLFLVENNKQQIPTLRCPNITMRLRIKNSIAYKLKL